MAVGGGEDGAKLTIHELAELVAEPGQHPFPHVGLTHLLDGFLVQRAVRKQLPDRLQVFIRLVAVAHDEGNHCPDPNLCTVVPKGLFLLAGANDQRRSQIAAIVDSVPRFLVDELQGIKSIRCLCHRLEQIEADYLVPHSSPIMVSFLVVFPLEIHHYARLVARLQEWDDERHTFAYPCWGKYRRMDGLGQAHEKLRLFSL